MSSLHRGDRHLHHTDGSHRWSGGPADQRGREAYLAALREHLQQHRAAFAAPMRAGRGVRTRRPDLDVVPGPARGAAPAARAPLTAARRPVGAGQRSIAARGTGSAPEEIQ